MNLSPLTLEPIGVFRSEKKRPYETASQGSLDESGEIGLIELKSGMNFEQALRGLSKMSHVWVLFWFDQNESWKPLVLPPRGTVDKQGVFATRSPYRPNPIGLSLVQIVEVLERRLRVKGFDLLDGTPILDLKPLHPQADQALDPKFGWMEHLEKDPYVLTTTPVFDRQAEFLFRNGVTQLVPFCRQQLRYDPFNNEKKRVKLFSDSKGQLAYRTWRIDFSTQGLGINLEGIQSGYSEAELSANEDRWGDRDLHLKFRASF